MEILVILLPLLLELIPKIIDKPEAIRKPAFLRRMLFFRKVSQADGDLNARMVAAELAELFGCLAEADDAEQREIVAGLERANAAAQAARGV